MHSIEYRDCFSDWSEGLPLGNGCFGGMGWLDESEGITFVLNHYDVFYKMLPWHSETERASGLPPRVIRPNMTVEEVRRRALEAHADPKHPAHSNYNFVLQPELATAYGQNREGAENAIAGELTIRPRRDVLESSASRTALEIESARLCGHVGKTDADRIDFEAKVADGEDLLIFRLNQTQLGLIEEIDLTIPLARLFEMSPLRSGIEDGVAFVENSFYPLGEDQEEFPAFRYAIALCLVGGEISTIEGSTPDRLRLNVAATEKELTLVVTVVSCEECADVVDGAVQRVSDAADRIAEIEKAHASHWSRFFNKSSVTLPDKLLETLWFYHLYSLAACSGERARIGQEACGLSGLWVVKSPSQWHSTWYWDVNIEQAFWPVFTSNHLELAKPFHRGLLSWVESAKDLARTYHALEGISPDYPHPFYLSIWPWCAQYFWWTYKYSLDVDFLREKAFPLFRDILKFYEGYVTYDPDGTLVTFPDVAPEQGPMCRNSMSTISSLKFLLRSAIESSVVLGEDEAEQGCWQKMLDATPDYAPATAPEFGEYFRDSEWASGLLVLAHSGILKSIYPIHEITKRSPENRLNAALGTLRYADKMQVFGTHNIWPAAAAASLGLGYEAVRLLYDRGLSLQMRPNGMLAEETDRWMQNCCVNLRPAYHPPLIEGGSTIVATINEMLLQSYDGLIEVFPAVPSVEDIHPEMPHLLSTPPFRNPPPVSPWDDVSFENLLAEGAVEVSAIRAGGKLREVKLRSSRGGTIRIVDGFNGPVEGPVLERASGEIHIELQPGQTCTLRDATAANETTPADVVAAPLAFQAFTRRRVFLGKDRDTEYLRALDAATLDYFPGHLPQSKLTIYKFDFGDPTLAKDYASVLPAQWHVGMKTGSDFYRISSGSHYHYSNGRGWRDSSAIQTSVASGPDDLRRDSLNSSDDAEFLIELAAGIYQLVWVLGDAELPSSTILTLPEQLPYHSRPLPADSYQLVTQTHTHRHDGTLNIGISCPAGQRWSLCAAILNRLL